MSQTAGPSDAANSQSSSEDVQCPECKKICNGRRGLNIHRAKVHKNVQKETSNSINQGDTGFPNDRPFCELLADLKRNLPRVKRIPRGARTTVAASLSQCINKVVEENNYETWKALLTFSYRTLHVQRGKDVKGSLTQKIKKNCKHSDNILLLTTQTYKNSVFNLTHKIESKVSDGDIRGAARLLFSDDTIAPDTPDTLSALASKHPPQAVTTLLPDPPGPLDRTPEAIAEETLAAVMSFRNGSAGGLDGLTPQHYKDLLCGTVGEPGRVLLGAVTRLVNLMLSGKVCEQVLDILYGASLLALKKKDGGIRPIAIGNTIRRVVSKICCKHILPDLTSKFQPIQLGFGTPGGCEAAVHATRTFLQNNTGEVILKVDVRNAFNSLDRGALLTEIKEQTPPIYNYIFQCYGQPSKLFYGNHIIKSAVGCQQGDPLGPAIFSLAIHPTITSLTSKLNIWYLDDGTLGGDASSVLNDLEKITSNFKNLGLELNFSKCELFVSDHVKNTNKDLIISKFCSLAPNIKIVDKESLRLLGAPILDDAVPKFVNEQVDKFTQCSERLNLINPQMALCIIRHCLFVPKLTYALRSSPLWKFQNSLDMLDMVLRQSMTTVLNCSLDDRSWSQATLPVRFGGLGVRKISSIALPAFLSSVYSTHALFGNIINPSLGDVEASYLAEARSAWTLACPGQDLPIVLESQKLWDEPLCEQVQKYLLDTATNLADRARLVATGERESGLWLHAIPSSNLGTLLDRTTFSIAICLRLGTKTNESHRCQCGASVDQLGHHGLSCQRSAGRWSRHGSLNDVIRRTLATVNVPAILEPNGIARDDGKRPDGMTLIPWQNGRSLVWDATCVDTLAASHVRSTAVTAGAAAAAAERNKRRKYAALGEGYMFLPFGVETFGPWGPDARHLYKQIASRLVDASGDPRAGAYLGQRISLAIQRGNAASVLGTLPADSDDLNKNDGMLDVVLTSTEQCDAVRVRQAGAMEELVNIERYHVPLAEHVAYKFS